MSEVPAEDAAAAGPAEDAAAPPPSGSNMDAADALVDSLAAMFQAPTDKFSEAFGTITSMFTETKESLSAHDRMLEEQAQMIAQMKAKLDKVRGARGLGAGSGETSTTSVCDFCSVCSVHGVHGTCGTHG